jgi:hypothetical protein
MKYSALSKRTAVFGAMLATAISLLACAVGGGSVTPVSGTTPTISATAVPTATSQATNSVTLFDAGVGGATSNDSATMPSGTYGLVRLTAANSMLTQGVATPATVQGAALVGLQLTITTGAMGLAGGTTANVDVVVHYAKAGAELNRNVNQGQSWDPGSNHRVTLFPIPPAATVGDIQSITILMALTSANTSTTWDLYRVTLVATFA